MCRAGRRKNSTADSKEQKMDPSLWDVVTLGKMTEKQPTAVIRNAALSITQATERSNAGDQVAVP